jgi:hypothetical protein
MRHGLFIGSRALLCAAALLPALTHAQDPCATLESRALVLGGGGSKGAFEAGAIYHLIVHRGCDFAEISGNSVGALNGALLAQAERSTDPQRSLENLRAAAENLISEWASIDDSRDVMRPRLLGKLRFALFGLDSVQDFGPLRQFLRERVSLDRLAAGRELRIGNMSFVDGRYREIVVNAGGQVAASTAHETIFSSALVPVFGRMPELPSPTTPERRVQYADAGVRHATPVTSYFLACAAGQNAAAEPTCTPLTGANTPPHPQTTQLFVVATSPYSRRNDLRPVVDQRSFDRRGGTITDGRWILVRMFDLLSDTMYRNDLDNMLLYNELLEWRAQAAGRLAEFDGFPLGSYNHPAGAPASLPYALTLIAPQREDTDPMSIFDVQPATQRRQLFCGCIAADDALRQRFGLASEAGQCRTRFRGLADRRGTTEVELDPALCRDERIFGADAPLSR